MAEGDLDILKSGLTDSQVIGMTSKFNTTWSWESLPTSGELLLPLRLSSSHGEGERVIENLFNIK